MPGPRTDETRYRVQSVDRAIDVLSAFTHEKPELELAEISRITSLTKSTAFRMLVTLSLRNLVSYDESTQRYSLGYGVLHLANVRSRQHSLATLALPFLVELRDELNETVSLSQRVGDDRVSIVQEESRHSFRRARETGLPVPLYAGSSSKAFLAAMSDSELDEYLERAQLVPFGPRTLTSPDALRAEVRSIRKAGYSLSHGERSQNAGAAVAAPIFGSNGKIAATVHVSVPDERFDEKMRARCIESVTETARRIGRELGGTGAAYPVGD